MPDEPLPPVLEPDTLARLKRLQAQVGPEHSVLQDLIDLFRPDAERYLDEVEQTDPAADPETILRAVHALKGAALGVGAARVAALCRRAEDAGADAARARAGELRQEVDTAVRALAAETGVAEPPSR